MTSFSTYSSGLNVTEDLGHIFKEKLLIFSNVSNVTEIDYENNFSKLRKRKTNA